jgi:DnaJ-class molecular chaperone
VSVVCKECKGKGTVKFTKERGGPGCNNCNGIGVMTPEIVRLHIGGMLDSPSLYMGGPSQQSLRKADKIVEYLREQGMV